MRHAVRPGSDQGLWKGGFRRGAGGYRSCVRTTARPPFAGPPRSGRGKLPLCISRVTRRNNPSQHAKKCRGLERAGLNFQANGHKSFFQEGGKTVVSFRHKAGEAPQSAPADSKSIGFPVPRLIVSAVALALGLGVTYYAQAQEGEGKGEGSASLDEVTVTGTRIKQ